MAALLRAIWPILLVVLVGGYLLRAALPRPPLTAGVTGLAFLLTAGIASWGWLSVRRRVAAFLKGARGEERVARELATLPEAFTVLHGVSAGGATAAAADFDHIVVGPTGVFVIETKNWSGTVTVKGGALLQDGRHPSRPPLDQVRHAVRELQQLLAEHDVGGSMVEGVVCLASDCFEPDCWSEPGVAVCNVSILREFLLEPRETGVDAVACERTVDALRGAVAG